MSHKILDKLEPAPKEADFYHDDGYEKRLKAHKKAVHQLALEGLKLDPEAKEWSMQVVRGEITGDEYIRRVLARKE